MDKSIADKLTRGGRRVHRDESGAIALAGLAATLIILMLGLVIWDTGKAVRDKIDLQNSADVAAYSQASVKARSMNMLTFTNVAKRSVVSLHNIYIAMWLGYTDWWKHKGEQCANCFGVCGACLDYYRNLPLIFAEGWGDWRTFSGFPFPAVEPRRALMATNAGGTGGMFKSLRKETYENEVLALDNYQEYIKKITPWWAWTESLVRGTRNGATLTTSFPPPDGLDSTAKGWIYNALQSSSYSHSPGPGIYDTLPVEPKYYQAACPLAESNAAIGGGAKSPRTQAANLENFGNLAIHEDRSKEAAAGTAYGWGLQYLLTGDPRRGGRICDVWAYQMFGNAMQPYSYKTRGSRVEDMLRRSNLVFSYKYTPDRKMDILPSQKTKGKDASKYDFVNTEYTVHNPKNATYGVTGFWSMARSEIAFADKQGLKRSVGWKDPISMWRAGWTARLRPVALPGEWKRLATKTGTNINSAFHATDKYLRVAREVGILDQPPLKKGGKNAGNADIAFMERATRLMTGGAINGVFK